MRYIGAHVSISGGLNQAIKRSSSLGATACALFISNPLRWTNVFLDDKLISDFKRLCVDYNYTSFQILPHSGFLINLGHFCDISLKKSRKYFINEINNCKKLGFSFLNFHPGSHLNKLNEYSCLVRIVDSINFALEHTEHVKLVIENTAGQGSNVGYCFEHLAFIVNKINDKSRIGICLDTCHLFAAGYDLRTDLLCKQTFRYFNDIVGLNYLAGMHFNDSKREFNSRVDRHHNLGQGYIGTGAFRWIIKNINCESFPIILETTNKKLWKQEIDWINSI